MRKLVALLVFTALLPAPFAHAQSTTAVVVANCGTPPSTYTAGQSRLVTQDTTGRVCQTPQGGTAPAPSTAVSTDASGTVTVGASYQTVFASSTTRKGCAIQNPTTATEDLSVRVKSAAVFTLGRGAMFQCGGPGGTVISDLVEVTGATTGHAFTAVSQ